MSKHGILDRGIDGMQTLSILLPGKSESVKLLWVLEVLGITLDGASS